MQTKKLSISLATIALAVALGPFASMAAQPMVTIYDNGKTTKLPASEVDEASYIKEGFVKNTAADGSVILERIKKSDVPLGSSEADKAPAGLGDDAGRR